jgi:hypothetical protein
VQTITAAWQKVATKSGDKVQQPRQQQQHSQRRLDVISLLGSDDEDTEHQQPEQVRKRKKGSRLLDSIEDEGGAPQERGRQRQVVMELDENF